MDGWAVRAELVQDAGTLFTDCAFAAAGLGRSRRPAAARCGCGLAAGRGDGAQGNNFEAIASVAPGTGVLAAGGNVERGALLRRAGERLRASDIAALAALGVAIVHARRPNIRITATNPRLGHGIAGALLKRAVEAAGGTVAIDDGASLERALLDEGADAVFVIGGTGQGKRDASVTALARVGSIAIHGFGIAPGETGALGEAGGRPVLAVSRKVGCGARGVAAGGIEARRAARRIDRAGSMTVEAQLARKIASQVGIAEVVPVRRGDRRARAARVGSVGIE